jgi:fibronectin-binding autotransporter adhesin
VPYFSLSFPYLDVLPTNSTSGNSQNKSIKIELPMKRLFFNRKRLLRAIHAAAVAFFLAAAAAARAQTANSDGNGNVTITGSGSNFTYNGTNPVLTAGGTLTVSGSSTISNTTVSIIISLSENATITNNGSLTVNENAAPSVTAGINSSGSAAASIINNTGTISASNTGSISAAGIYYHTGTGAVTINNSGSVSGTYTGSLIPQSASGGYGIWTTTTGAVTINSSGSGTISGTTTAAGSAIAIRAVDSLNAITISNAGTTLTASGYYSATGIDALSRGGPVSITNSGAISATTTSTIATNYGPSAYGIAALTANGFSVSINNSGNITASAAYGATDDIYASGSTAPVSVNNTATLTATSSGSGSYSAYGIYATSTDGAITLTNSGHVTASSTYSVYGVEGYASGTGSVTVSNAALVSVTSTSSSTNSHVYGVAAYAGGGGNATLTNSATVTASGGYITQSLSAYGANVSVTNSGQLNVTDTVMNPSGTASGIYAGGSGTVSVGNSAAITAQASTGFATGINVMSTGGNASLSNNAPIMVSGYFSSTDLQITGATATLTNSGSLTSQGVNSNTALGINAASTVGTLMVTNSGSINASGTYVPATDIQLQGTGDTTLTTTGTQVLTATGHYDGAAPATGESVSSSAGSVTVSNGQTISLNGDQATGINASSQTGTVITNGGTMSVSGTYAATGILASTTTGNTSVTNSGSITTASSYNGEAAYGIQGDTTTSGNVTLANSGQVVVTAMGNSYGLWANNSQAVGSILINNTGNSSGTSTGGIGYGIYANSSGPIVVNNTGSALGSAYGIYLVTPGTVNNHGRASGGTNSIYVPSGSTVNLIGASPVLGLLKGGADASSTSMLNFQIAIRGNVASAKATLDAAIAAYDQAYTAANGVGNVDSSVVVLNGISYQWEDFFGIGDNLVQGRLYANTPGFASLGGVLDTLPTNATSTQILNALNNLPDSAVAAALAELSPKELQIFRNVAFDNNTFNVANVNNHLANRRDGLTGFDDSQMSVRDGSMDPTLNQVRSHLLAFNPAPNSGLINDSTDSILGGMDMKDMRVNTMPTDRWSSFISGDVILADTSHNTNLEDADYTTGNVTGGLDYRLDQHFTVGALFAYAHTDANLDSRGSSATVDSYSPGIYASYVDGPWYANALGAYTRNAYTEDRQIDIVGLGGDNHGATSGNQGSVNLTGGYEFQKGSFKFGPVASLQYVHLSIDSIQEDGPTALSIASQDQDSFRSLLGFEGRFSTKVATCYGPMILTPHVSASWQHEYLDNSQGINADFTGTGGGSFTTETDTPDRDSAFVDVGLDATVAKDVTLFVDYEAQAGQENFFAQSARGGVKIGF